MPTVSVAYVLSMWLFLFVVPNYVAALVTAQIAREVQAAGKEIEKLYGTLSEDLLTLQ